MNETYLFEWSLNKSKKQISHYDSLKVIFIVEHDIVWFLSP